MTASRIKLKNSGINIPVRKMKKIKLLLGGIAVGIVNALFGAGGGMIAVPILSKEGLRQREAQATAVSVILPLTVVTSVIYYLQGTLSLSKAKIYILPGVIGAAVGSFALKKVPDNALKKCFAIFLLWAGGRMIFS